MIPSCAQWKRVSHQSLTGAELPVLGPSSCLALRPTGSGGATAWTPLPTAGAAERPCCEPRQCQRNWAGYSMHCMHSCGDVCVLFHQVPQPSARRGRLPRGGVKHVPNAHLLTKHADAVTPQGPETYCGTSNHHTTKPQCPVSTVNVCLLLYAGPAGSGISHQCRQTRL